MRSWNINLNRCVLKMLIQKPQWCGFSSSETSGSEPEVLCAVLRHHKTNCSCNYSCNCTAGTNCLWTSSISGGNRMKLMLKEQPAYNEAWRRPGDALELLEDEFWREYQKRVRWIPSSIRITIKVTFCVTVEITLVLRGATCGFSKQLIHFILNKPTPYKSKLKCFFSWTVYSCKEKIINALTF